MAIERTLSILKPDATRRNLTGKVNTYLEDAGLRIIAQRRIRLTRERAEAFYAVHKDRPFYNDLCTFMTSGPVVVQVLEGEDAVTRNRKIMGATNPAEAEAGTIRKDFAESVEANTATDRIRARTRLPKSLSSSPTTISWAKTGTNETVLRSFVRINQYAIDRTGAVDLHHVSPNSRAALGDQAQRARIANMFRREDAGGKGRRVVSRAHRNRRLHDNRPLVHLRAHEMDRATGEFDAGVDRPLVRVETGKRGQQRRMDVDESIVPVIHEGWRQNAHEAGGTDEGGTGGFEGAGQFEFKAGSILEIFMIDDGRIDAGGAGAVEARGARDIRNDHSHLSGKRAIGARVDERLEIRAAPGNQYANLQIRHAGTIIPGIDAAIERVRQVLAEPAAVDTRLYLGVSVRGVSPCCRKRDGGPV